ncbi:MULTISPECIES: thioredoxin family protein [Ureibacillus]|uniref:thioredoxin family protein n=1 Tax=Ureibacillus TaxID=160795 RepID=UPI000BBC3E8B|nr:thioredoxin family protein [Ureibacillus thermosphaericus]
MKTEQQYFEQGISMAEYMEQMKTNLKEGSFEIYHNFKIDENDELIPLLKEKKPHILTITEDWCGDAMLNNPIMRKIAEAAGLDIRCVFRDEDTDLIDRYLTNGGRAIPIYLFLNEEGQVIGKWGPRAPELQQLVVEERAKLPAKDNPTFEEKQKELYTTLQEKFVKDPQCAKWVYEDMKKVIMEMLS